MRHIRMAAIAGALACGLALGACGTGGYDTTGTTPTTGVTGSVAIPLNADGTVDEDLFFQLIERAEETITSEVVTSRLVDPVTREPLDDNYDTTYADRRAGRILRIQLHNGLTHENFTSPGGTWTRIDGGAWQPAAGEEAAEETTGAYWENPLNSGVEIVDLRSRTFLVHQQYRGEEDTHTVEITLDGQLHVIESFTDYGDGTARLEQTTSINQPVDFPTDLPI